MPEIAASTAPLEGAAGKFVRRAVLRRRANRKGHNKQNGNYRFNPASTTFHREMEIHPGENLPARRAGAVVATRLAQALDQWPEYKPRISLAQPSNAIGSARSAAPARYLPPAFGWMRSAP
jgi:hypothetical protein